MQIALRQTDEDMAIHPVDHTWQLSIQALPGAFHRAATMIPFPLEDSFSQGFSTLATHSTGCSTKAGHTEAYENLTMQPKDLWDNANTANCKLA